MRHFLPLLLVAAILVTGVLLRQGQRGAPLPASQLIVEAVLGGKGRADSAQAQLRGLGHCPHLEDSPETPVGLAGAAYDQPGGDSVRVRRTIELLLAQGCDVDQYSAAGLTPLHGAIIGRQADLFEFLLAAGADPQLRVVAIPGSALGSRIAHLDAYGVAQVVRLKHPDDPGISRILERLQPMTVASGLAE